MKRITLIGLVLVIALCCASRAVSQWESFSFDQKAASMVSTANVVFAGTSTNGVYRSTNNGLNWSVASAGLPTLNVRALAVSGQRVYAGTDSGAFMSTNGGISWSTINQGLSEVGVYTLAATDSLVFAGTMNGIFRSSDCGANWTKGVLPSGYATLIYAIAMNGSSVYAGTEGYHGMMYRSTDAGITWSTTVSLGTVWALAMMGPRVIAGTYNGVRLTQDDGASWQRMDAGIRNLTIRSLIAQNGYLLAGTQGGVYVSTDSATSWMSLNTGLTDTAILAMAVHGETLFAGSDGKIWRRRMTDLNAVPETPVLGAPSNHASGQRISVHLRWGKPDLTSFFHLQVGTDSTFLSGVIVDSAAYPDTVIQLGGLRLSQGYFWRVAARNSHGAGTYSEVWSFETLASAPLSPSLVSPAANGFVTGTTAVLAWHPAPDASSYRFQVAGEPSFASPLIDSTVVDTTGRIYVALLTRCYWRVQAKNDFGSGSFSDIRLFTVVRSPVLIAPHNGATRIPPGTSLTWHPVPGATGYRITVALDVTFAGPSIVDDTILVDTSRTTSELNLYSTYYWRVRARYDSLEGPVSETWFFDTRTSGAAEIFPLRKGMHSPYIYSRSYSYEYGWKEWDVDSGTVSYDVMDVVYPNDTTAVWSVRESTHLLHHHWIIDLGGTVGYDSTYWQSSASTMSLTESLMGYHELLCQSRVWLFPQLPDSQPVPQWSGREPVYRFWQDTSRTLKQYEQPPDPDRYQLLHFAEYRGLADRTYFFRSSGNHVTIISVVATYVTQVTGAAGSLPPAQPDATILLQNYPNPFNPSTTIRYGLPARSHVALTVFNTLGQQVVVLQNGEQDAGYHEAIFHAQGLPSGVYFYRLRAGSYNETKKLLLVQ